MSRGITRLLDRALRVARLRPAYQSDPIPGFALSESERATYFQETLTEIERMFLAHDGRLIHKWTHYLPIYEQLFARFRGTDVRFLEIGISQGGSLELWRKFFGIDARIAGIDIDDACRNRVDPPIRAFIGSQSDQAFLSEVVREFGRPNIVLDDGSHVASDQRTSFEMLFPHLEDGGLYVIEDTHTSYWGNEYQGGFRIKSTAIEYFKERVDDMHGWYHALPSDAAIRDSVRSICFYESIIVIEKSNKLPPRHVTVGTPA